MRTINCKGPKLVSESSLLGTKKPYQLGTDFSLLPQDQMKHTMRLIYQTGISDLWAGCSSRLLVDRPATLNGKGFVSEPLPEASYAPTMPGRSGGKLPNKIH